MLTGILFILKGTSQSSSYGQFQKFHLLQVIRGL